MLVLIALVTSWPATQQMQNACEKSAAISVVNCSVKLASGSKDEVTTNRSKVESSPRKFSVPTEMREVERKGVQLSELDSVGVNQQVTVSVKVVSVSAGETVSTKSGEKKKQDCRVGDASASTRLVVWESDVGSLEEGQCYKIVGVGVKSFGGVRYLSVGRDCKVEKSDEIGDVVEQESGEEEQESGAVGQVVEGEIDGVVLCDECSSCMSCKAKTRSINDVVSECSNCGLLMKSAKCTKSVMAKVVVSGKDGKEHTLTMFDEVVRKVIDGASGEGLAMKLLEARPMKLYVDKRDD